MKILAPSPTELTRGRAATPIAFIRAIVTGYRRRGMDPASALAQAQIRHIGRDGYLLEMPKPKLLE